MKILSTTRLLPAHTASRPTPPTQGSNGINVGFFGTPPLRYVGSKWMLAEWIIKRFPPHQLYVEPFVGSGAVFFRKRPSPVEVINDMDGELVNFFEMLRTRPADLLRAVRLTPWSEREYRRSFELCDDPLERARQYYVSVWQSFGGTLVSRSGWRHQVASEMRSALTKTWRRMDGLEAAADRLLNAQLSDRPAVDCIQHWDTPETVFYVDPPYPFSSRASGRRKRYRHEMTTDDHRELAATLRSVKGYVVLSGYRCGLYDELFAGWTRVDKSSTTNGNGSATESLWLSPRTTAITELPLFAYASRQPIAT